VVHWARRYMDKLREILDCQPNGTTRVTDSASSGGEGQLSDAELAEIESLLARPGESDS